ALFELKDVTHYCLAHECWMKDFRGQNVTIEEVQRVQMEGVRNRPDKDEVVMFQSEFEGQPSVAGFRKIIRPPGKARAYLDVLETYEGMSGEGRFAGMLPVKGKMQ